MPKVPTYDLPQEQARPLPAVRQESIASPALFAAETEGVEAVSKGLFDVGTGALAVSIYQQDRENATAVFGVETKRKEELLALEKDMRENYQGEKAKGAAQRVKDWWDEQGKKDLGAFTNDAQRQLYLRRMSAQRLNSLNAAAKFEEHHLEQALEQNWKAGKVSATNLAAATPTDQQVELSRAEILKNNSFMAQRRGWNKSVLDAVNSEDLTHLHREVIGALVATDKDQAAKYYEKWKDDIAGKDRDKLSESAKKATAEARGREAAGEIYSRLGPSVGIDKMAEEARKVFKDDTFALGAAISDLKDRVQLFDKAEHDRTQSVAAKINLAVMGGATVSQIRAMPEFNALVTSGPAGVKAAGDIITYQESKAYTAEARAAARESRADAAESRAARRLAREGFETYLWLSDPDILSKRTRDEVLNTLPLVGPEHAASLLQRYDQITRSADALANARIDNDTFRMLVTKAGFDLDKKQQSKDDTERIAALRFAVDARLATAARAKGRPLTFEERYAESARAVDDKVRVPGFFFGLGGTDRPVSTLKPEELEAAVVELPTGRVRIAEIPAGFIEKLNADRVRAGRTGAVTQRLLAEAWLLNKDAWVKRNSTPAKARLIPQ